MDSLLKFRAECDTHDGGLTGRVVIALRDIRTRCQDAFASGLTLLRLDGYSIIRA